MIAYLPELYEDELVYSWFARYFAHMYPSYTNALEDILESKNIRTDVEFINRLHPNAKEAITRIIPMEELVLRHTMFPYYRFAENARLCAALKSMSDIGEDAHRLLPVFKSRVGEQIRYIKYCPLCAEESRQTVGEAYWTRSANIRNIDICCKHRCRLKTTNIEISGKKSGRLYVAEEEIDDTVPEILEDNLGFKFAEYMMDVFNCPIDFQNSVPVGVFLRSKLEDTQYLSVRGMQMHIGLLLDDLMDFYGKMYKQEISIAHLDGQDIMFQGITKKHQIQHIFSGKCTDFYKICQLAFFLNVSPVELTNPMLPQKTQTEIFNAEVAQLYAQGLGCHRIAKKMGCSSTTARKANQVKEKRFHDYSAARKGKQAMDWDKVDANMLPEVQKAINQIYGSGDIRPKRVTETAVSKYMGWPSKRFDYLPECRRLVQSYYEEYPIYWAREVVWCYRYLAETIGEEFIKWRDIRDITNLRKDNFYASFPYLKRFTDVDTADKIKNLLPLSNIE